MPVSSFSCPDTQAVCHMARGGSWGGPGGGLSPTLDWTSSVWSQEAGLGAVGTLGSGVPGAYREPRLLGGGPCRPRPGGPGQRPSWTVGAPAPSTPPAAPPPATEGTAALGRAGSASSQHCTPPSGRPGPGEFLLAPLLSQEHPHTTRLLGCSAAGMAGVSLEGQGEGRRLRSPTGCLPGECRTPAGVVTRKRVP